MNPGCSFARKLGAVFACWLSASPAWGQDAPVEQPPVAEPAAAPDTAESDPGAENAPPPVIELLQGSAKLDYEAARVFFDKGDYANALVKFQSAYEGSHDPRLLWNSAACEVKLFHYSRAGRLIRRYLASRSPLITEAARERARAFLEAAEQLTVGLVVKSSIADAEVYVDGEYLGRTPLGVKPADIRVDPGRHELTVKKQGFDDFRETLTVTGSADHAVHAPLKPIVHEGRLIVRAKPGDLIQVDGEGVGYGSFDGPLPSGQHTLRVTAPEDRPFETKVVIVDNRSHTFQVDLEPLPADWGIPTWAWIGGASVLAAGAGVGAYFLLKPEASEPPQGTLDTITVELR